MANDLVSLLSLNGVVSADWATSVANSIQAMIDGSQSPPQAPSVESYRPPIGIPDPGFGISSPVAVWPAAWPGIAVDGHYFIDNTHAAAMDTDNPYGCPDKPRMTIPPRVILQPGSVVEIHGGPYELTARWRFQGGGAADNYAFIRGSSPGDGIGGQYGPENVWIIFNRIHDCDYGIRFSSDTGGGGTGFGQNIYILGNLICNIRHSDWDVTGKWPVAYDSQNAWSPGRAIAIWHSSAVKRVVGNSIRDVDAGVVTTRQNNAVEIIGNIIEGVSPADYDIWIEQPSSAAKSTMEHNLFVGQPRIRWGSPVVMDLPAFELAFPERGGGNRSMQ